MSKSMFKLLFSPDDVPGVGNPGEELSTQELVDFLKDDEEKEEVLDLKVEKKEKVEKPSDDNDEDDDDETKDDEKTLEDELEEELDEEKKKEKLDDDDDIENLVTPPSRKEILAKYPNLYKDFPHLEKAFYREQKYTELYPTIKHAEQAAEKAQTWDQLEQDLTSGNLQGILSAVANSNKNTFYQIVYNILPTISEIDKDAATHIYSGVAKEIIELMVNAGQKEGQESLKVAAHLIHQFLFGPKDYEPHKPLARKQEKDPRVDEVSRKERELIQRQFLSARDEIATRVNNTIKATIERNIDPKESMTPYVKEKAVEDVFKEVQTAIKTDKRFQAIMSRLWEQALRKDFNDESKQAIRSAILSKAKQLMLPAIQKGRKVALGNVRLKANDQEPVKPGPSAKRDKPSSLNLSGKSDRERAKQIPKNMSTKDFLLSD